LNSGKKPSFWAMNPTDKRHFFATPGGPKYLTFPTAGFCIFANVCNRADLPDAGSPIRAKIRPQVKVRFSDWKQYAPSVSSSCRCLRTETLISCITGPKGPAAATPSLESPIEPPLPDPRLLLTISANQSLVSIVVFTLREEGFLPPRTPSRGEYSAGEPKCSMGISSGAGKSLGRFDELSVGVSLWL